MKGHSPGQTEDKKLAIDIRGAAAAGVVERDQSGQPAFGDFVAPGDLGH
jgi:hypothetical protein